MTPKELAEELRRKEAVYRRLARESVAMGLIPTAKYEVGHAEAFSEAAEMVEDHLK